VGGVKLECGIQDTGVRRKIEKEPGFYWLV